MERNEKQPQIWSGPSVHAPLMIRSEAFPTELQVLSDDLIRGKQLRGKRYAQVTRPLGKPEETDRATGGREVGSERDSFAQVDSEYLTIRFDRHGRFRAASFSQG